MTPGEEWGHVIGELPDRWQEECVGPCHDSKRGPRVLYVWPLPCPSWTRWISGGRLICCLWWRSVSGIPYGVQQGSCLSGAQRSSFLKTSRFPPHILPHSLSTLFCTQHQEVATRKYHGRWISYLMVNFKIKFVLGKYCETKLEYHGILLKKCPYLNEITHMAKMATGRLLRLSKVPCQISCILGLAMMLPLQCLR